LDNITHTLVGLLVGEATSRALPATRGLAANTKRNLIVGLMTIGSNVPDLDLIPSRISGSKLEYLLHHRGHTHTILGAFALAAVLLALCELWCRWRRYELTSRNRAELGAATLLSLLLHIALDYGNSYGVHPFWPFDNRWLYGDSIFIVEPSFWAACAPLVFVLRSPLARIFVALAVVAGLALGRWTGIVPMPLWIALLLLSLAMLAVGKLASSRTAVIAALVVCVGINVMFGVTGATAAQRAREAAAQSYPQLVLLDHILTPMPANPLCWQLVLVQRDDTSWYVRRAMLALSPRWFTAARCPSRSDDTKATAEMQKIAIVATPRIAWNDEIKVSRATLTEWIAKDCVAAAFMRFARAPWLAQLNETWVIGDARFDFERELNFAELELGEASEGCLAYVPPWVPPRADLVEGLVGF